MQSSPCCLLSRLPKPTPWFIALLADITQVACAVRLEAPLSSPPASEPPLSPHDECVPSAFASTAAVAARFEPKELISGGKAYRKALKTGAGRAQGGKEHPGNLRMGEGGIGAPAANS